MPTAERRHKQRMDIVGDYKLGRNEPEYAWLQCQGLGEAMSYLGEFRVNWRYLASAAIGIASGYGITNYLNNVFIPPLMAEFGWTSSDIALIGIAAVVSVVCQPISGRITDRVGVRWVAAFGVACSTLLYIALSRMTGSFLDFFLLIVAQIALVSATTGPVVYSRLIAQTYDRARGVALAIAICSPSMAGAVVVPMLSGYIEHEGWRAGYLLVAAVTAVVGAFAILLIPGPSRPAGRDGEVELDLVQVRDAILRNPAFKLLVGGTLLCSVTVMMQVNQLKFILLDSGLPDQRASYIISIYAIGVIVGRVLCGAALDRFPAHYVAAISLGLPAIGLVVLAMGFSSPVVLALAVLFLGLSLGAEGDVVGYLVMTFFRVEVYSTVVGIAVGSIALSAAIGSLILSVCLDLTGSFAPFLLFAGLSALAGSRLFWSLGRIERPLPVPGGTAASSAGS